MRVQVRYFAALREAVGLSEESLDVPAGTRVDDLLALLAARRGPVAAQRSSLRLAVGTRFAQPGQALCEGDEVALLPPVSGG